MKKSTLLAALAVLVVVLTGCATSGPAYKASAFHRLATSINHHPKREGMVVNSRRQPLWVSIDDEPTKIISSKVYRYFKVTAKEPHHLVAKDEKGKVIKDYTFIIRNAPLGSQLYLPFGKTIDTGWIEEII